MAKISPVRRAQNHIRVCDWEKLRDEWLNYIPLIHPPGTPPKELVCNWASVREEYDIADQLPDESPIHITKIDRIHATMLSEAVFLLHKSWHVVGAAETDASSGMMSWSLSSGYQAAFFAIKAVMILLGYPLLDLSSGKMALVELFPPQKRSPELSVSSVPQVVIIALAKTLGHQDIWSIFQRLCNQTEVSEELWPTAEKKFVGLCDSKRHFAKERNDLHYRNDHWPLDDLHQKMEFADSFGRPIRQKASKWTFDPGGYSLWLGKTCFMFGFSLLQDLSSNGSVLKDEISLIVNEAVRTRHPIWAELAYPTS